MKFVKKIRTRNLFITLCIVGIGMLIVTMGEKYHITAIENSMQYITVPIQKGFHFVTQGIGGTVSRVQNVSTLEEDNISLQKKVEQLSYENTILAEYKTENEHLKQLLQLSQRYREYPNEGANVIGKDPGNWYKMFTIDKGTNVGLAEDNVILSGEGLVGHIVEAGALSSKVLAIIDDRSAVSAVVARTGDIGIVKGDIELMQQGLCKLQIDIQSEVIKGDQILTSHLSAVYPPGITIGVVEEITISQDGLTQYAYVRPVVDFKHLEQVLVLKAKDLSTVQD